MKKELKTSKKIVVGLSGGVDSSVALILLKKQGFEPIAVTLDLPTWKNKLPSHQSARAVCKKLEIPYFIIDAQKEFQQKVIKYFTKELKNYHTPNPCLICNRNLKIALLWQLAKQMKIPYVATGHYAKIRFNKKTKLFELLKGKDKNKDQSYSLSFLKQDQLKHLVLPLGNYTKKEVYQIAKKEGFTSFEAIKQSQDFCFVSNQDLPAFLQKQITKKPGPILDLKGNILGQHQGLCFYTIGQRKGLNLANGPYYVVGFLKKKNSLLVSKHQKDLYKREAVLSPLNLIAGKIKQKRIKVAAKIRYRAKAASATLYLLSRNRAKIVFDKPQKAITPGQFCVFYQKDICLGNGIISSRV